MGMVSVNQKVNLNFGAVIKAMNKGISGSPVGGYAIVGPTASVAWYGQIHEFGTKDKGGRFPERAFMRPALRTAQPAINMMYLGAIKSGIPILAKAAALVERIAKQSMRKGGGKSKSPSKAGTPPNVQSGDLRNSIRYAIIGAI